MLNRQWLLVRRPTGLCSPEDFLYREEQCRSPVLRDGEIFIRNMAFLCAPTIRNWMDEAAGDFIPSIRLCDPVRGPCAARVIASANPDFPAGSRVCTISNWQDFDVVSPANTLIRPIPDGYTFIEALGPVGMNALTAYFGLHEIGRPKAGETLLVSGAAGSVGTNATQIGKILGCRVIGLAGGKAKCDWLLDHGCVDHCIDYRNEDVPARIAVLCPQGVDIYFDNVGGATLQTAIDNMARFGRIILCGQISGYNDGAAENRIGNLMRLVYGSIRMEGFLASNYIAQFSLAMSRLAGWIEQGRLLHREDVRVGMEVLPFSLNALFDGSNTGTLIVQIADEATQTR
jgi:NADPH-dependent curcumin reductase CurA